MIPRITGEEAVPGRRKDVLKDTQLARGTFETRHANSQVVSVGSAPPQGLGSKFPKPLTES